MTVVIQYPERPRGGSVVAVAIEHNVRVVVDACASQEGFELGHARQVAPDLVL